MVTPPYNLSALACARFPEARNNAQRGEKRSKSIRCEYDRRIEPPPHALSGKKDYAKWRLAFTRPDVNEDGHDLFSKQSRADSKVPRIWTRLVVLVAWYASTYVPVEIDEVAPYTEHKRLQARREGYAPCGKSWPSSTKTAFFSVGASCVMKWKNDA
jgi:hypothetical protein